MCSSDLRRSLLSRREEDRDVGGQRDLMGDPGDLEQGVADGEDVPCRPSDSFVGVASIDGRYSIFELTNS